MSKLRHSLAQKETWRNIIYISWGILFFLLLVSSLIPILDNWRDAQGYEYEWIAQNLAKGFGYTFEAQHRWLFPEGAVPTDTGRYPTAWVEPGYTLMMAAAFWLFEEEGRLVLVILQTIFWFATALVIVFLSKRVFTVWTGLLAGMLLVVTPATRAAAHLVLSNVMLAGLFVSISTLFILWSLDKISVKRGAHLGLVLGVTILVHSAIFLFLPASILLILFHREAPFHRRWKTVLAITLTTILVISPWVLRNFIVFDQFVPLRNGFGFNSYIGNPPLVEMYNPGYQACAPTGQVLQVESGWGAVQAARRNDVQRALYERAYQCIQESSEDHFTVLNEAGRDRKYLAGTIGLLLERPVLWMGVTLYKALLFLAATPFRGILSLLALIGSILGLRNRDSNVLSLLVLLYVVPYAVALPFFYRYRYPIEPLILVLASSTIIYILRFLFEKARSIRSAL